MFNTALMSIDAFSIREMTIKTEKQDANKRHILLVDDKPENLRLLDKILSAQQYAVHPAMSAEAALRFLQSTLPDLILLDVMMPGMDGYQLCNRLKADERTCDIPVIFISAGGQIADKAKAFERGGVDYITKPFLPEEVLMRVQAHLAIRDQQKRLQVRVHEQSAEVAQMQVQLNQEIIERKEAQQRLAGLEQMINLKLIESKLDPLQLPEHVLPIPRIEAMFESAWEHRLTSLTAPAGYGKSTTLAKLGAFVEAKKMPICWVSLDETDNAPHHFLQYLLSALRRVQAQLGSHVPDRSEVHSAPTVEAALGALNHGLDALPGGTAFFLDDYHTIDNQAVHDLLDRIIAHSPRSVRFFIASRAQLPLSLSKLRLAGDLYEIRTEDLALPVDEASSFIAAVSGHTLGITQMRRLHDCTEGWPAGLQLAALAIKGGQEVDSFINGFSGRDRDVTAYVGEMVLSRLPPGLVEFLHFAALFDRFSADLCRDLFSANDSLKMIEQIRAQNLFLISLDREHHWYRFHQLFGDYLKGAFIQQHPDKAQTIYREASVWFERHDLLSEAIRYALAGNEQIRAANLLTRTASELSRQRGEHSVLVDWVSMLPAAYVDERTDLKLAYAWSLMFSHRFSEAQAVLESLERRIRSSGNDPTSAYDDVVGRRSAMLRCIFHTLTDHAELAAPLCLDWLSQWGTQDPADTAIVQNALGYCLHLEHDYKAAERHFRTAKATFQGVKEYYGTAWAEAAAAIAAIARGEIQEADRMLVPALDAISKSLGLRSHAGSMLALLHAQICYEQNRLEEAGQLIDDMFEFAHSHGVVETIFAAYRTRARLLALKCSVESADRCLMDGLAIANGTGLRRLSLMLEAERILLYLCHGRLDHALDVATAIGLTESGATRIDTEVTSFHEDISLRILFVQLQYAAGAVSQLPAPSPALLNEARRQGRNVLMIKLLCLRATWQAAQGNHEEALRSLDEALAIGTGRGLVRVFEDAGSAVVGMLREIAATRLPLQNTGVRESSLSYLLQIIGALDRQSVEQVQTAPAFAPFIVKSDEFSEREIKILTLLAYGLSNRDLAAQLFLSEGTVKWYLHNIYGKLDVNNRAGAIAKARQMSLVP
jgi:ATP/maltotriose-dependent transcriptional regulator MalT/response regulator of citrate/malate metabolism